MCMNSLNRIHPIESFARKDSDYVGYTARHLHQRIVEHKKILRSVNTFRQSMRIQACSKKANSAF